MPLVQLTGPQLLRLRNALEAMFPTEATFEEFLLTLDKHFDWLSASSDVYPTRILAVLKRAVADEWVLALIAEALNKVRDPVLLTVQQEIGPLPPAQNLDHFEVCRLTGNHVMVDRTKLRSALRDLSRPLGKRILIVKGKSKSGKSYSVQLIAYLRQMLQSFRLAAIDLDEFARALGPGVLIEPNLLAERIVRLAKYQVAVDGPPLDQQWSRWSLKFCDEFEAVASIDEVPRWIVIDAFNSVLLPQQTLDLIKELTNRINLTLPNLRLVLLGYDLGLPPAVLPHVEEETICSLSEKELIEFFAKAYQELQLPFDEDVVADAVQHVLGDTDLNHPDFLPNLGPRIIEQLAKPIAPGGTHG